MSNDRPAPEGRPRIESAPGYALAGGHADPAPAPKCACPGPSRTEPPIINNYGGVRTMLCGACGHLSHNGACRHVRPPTPAPAPKCAYRLPDGGPCGVPRDEHGGVHDEHHAFAPATEGAAVLTREEVENLAYSMTVVDQSINVGKLLRNDAALRAEVERLKESWDSLLVQSAKNCARADAAEAEVDLARREIEKSAAFRIKAEAEVERLKERLVTLTEGDDSLAARLDAAEAEAALVTKRHNECHDEIERQQARVARLTEALREIADGLMYPDDHEGQGLPMNAEDVVRIARRALEGK